MDGFDEFADDINDLEDDLDDLEDNIQELDDTNAATLTDLLTESFMRKYTDFESFEAFCEASPWEVETEEDLEAIPDAEADQYVNKHTQFTNSEQMMGKAHKEWTARQLGL